MKRAVLQMAVLLLRLVYLPIRLLPVKKKVAIISRQAERPTEDIRLLQAYFRKRSPQIPCVTLVKMIGKGMAGKLAYLPHMLQQMVQLTTSEVVLLDGYCIVCCVLPHKKRTKVIQMWHAVTAVKKFGYQTIGCADGHSPAVAEALCMHRNYDYVLSPGGETDRLFCEAFDTPGEKLVHLGLPRIDLLRAPEEERRGIRLAYGIPEDREILLYVPTFRKGRPADLKDLAEAIDSGRYVLVVRLHPLDEAAQQKLPQEGEGLQIIFDRSRSTEEWIGACDRVITDYSALALEAALAGKPLYYYIHDIERYERETGLNIDPRKEMPQAAALTAGRLAELLEEPYDYEALRAFRDKYSSIDTEDCTVRLGDFIYGIVEEIHPEISNASSEDENSGT